MQSVLDGLDDAQNFGGEAAVQLIEGYLTQYEAAQASLNDGASEAGLVKADVLEWEPGARNSGFQGEMERLRNLISNVLALDALVADYRGKTDTNSNRVKIKRG